MNLMFTLDSNYIPQLKVCVRSVTRFPSKDGWDIYILTGDPGEKFKDAVFDMEKEFGARVHLITVDDMTFDDFPETARYSKVVYYRIFAARLLPDNLDRILYLDPDTVVIKPLDGLYGMDFDNNYFIACSHTKAILTKLNRVRLGIRTDAPYINTGVMMMNLELLRREQTVKEVREYVEKRGKFFILPDQDVITALYGDRVKLIDTFIYNLSDRLIYMNNLSPITNELIDMDWVRKNTVIIHYYGDNKPWKENYSLNKLLKVRASGLFIYPIIQISNLRGKYEL